MFSLHQLESFSLDALFGRLTEEFSQVEVHISTVMRLKREAAERDRVMTAMLVESVDARLASARPIVEKIRQVGKEPFNMN